MLSNAYLLAKFRFDTAENEPAKNLQNCRKMHFDSLLAACRPEGLTYTGVDDNAANILSNKAYVNGFMEWPNAHVNLLLQTI